MAGLKIKTIVVEDHPQHSSSLIELLAQIPKPVEVLDVCTNVNDAFASINKSKPDLIFLDIDLDKGESGFDLLKKFEKPEFGVIFTTQHNNASYIISALRACALDFLTKPLLLTELEEALNRFNKKEGIEQIGTLKNNIESKDDSLLEIWIKSTEGRTRIETDNIIHCKSDDNCTHFYLAQAVNRRQKYTSSESIKDWEKCLANSGIIRIHNEFLVNLRYVITYSSRPNNVAALILQNGNEVPVSRKRKTEVKKALNLFRQSR